jgi:succinoglycan biosynthesis transport protein ExoP
MQDSFDALEYVGYLRQRWVFLSTACAVAVFIALIVSTLIPKQYTATASIVIDAPAGNDVRTATAVSPVYLESLKSYEYLASSDTLFQKALDHYHIRDSGELGTIESLKRRMLKVSKLRDTRILEISISRPDPKQAQAIVQFIAQETVKLNQGLAREGDRDLTTDAESQQTAASEQLQKAQAQWAELSTREPLESLQSEINAAVELQARVRQQMLQAQVDVTERSEQLTPDKASSDFWKRDLAAARAKASLLEKQSKDLDRQVEQKSALLAQRSTKRDAVLNQLRVARTAFDAAAARSRDMQNTSGFRGERLRIIDPGIVPQRPSYPNISLNAFVALLFGAAASVLYLTVAFQSRPPVSRRPLRFAGKTADG